MWTVPFCTANTFNIKLAPKYIRQFARLPVLHNNIFVSSGEGLEIYSNDTAFPGAERKGMCILYVHVSVFYHHDVVSNQHRVRDLKPVRKPSHIFRNLFLLLVNTGGEVENVENLLPAHEAVNTKHHY